VVSSYDSNGMVAALFHVFKLVAQMVIIGTDIGSTAHPGRREQLLLMSSETSSTAFNKGNSRITKTQLVCFSFNDDKISLDH